MQQLNNKSLLHLRNPSLMRVCWMGGVVGGTLPKADAV